jgi:hypothetical protein
MYRLTISSSGTGGFEGSEKASPTDTTPASTAMSDRLKILLSLDGKRYTSASELLFIQSTNYICKTQSLLILNPAFLLNLRFLREYRGYDKKAL